MFENLGFFEISVFDIHWTDVWNPRFSNIRVFGIHCRWISKTLMFENLGFFEISVFDIHWTDVWNPRFSNIRVFGIHYRWISKTRILKISDFWNPSFRQMFENLGFLKSMFSIFTIGEYRKHGFLKVGEKKSAISAISETSAFSIWLVLYLLDHPGLEFWPNFSIQDFVVLDSADWFVEISLRKENIADNFPILKFHISHKM